MTKLYALLILAFTAPLFAQTSGLPAPSVISNIDSTTVPAIKFGPSKDYGLGWSSSTIPATILYAAGTVAADIYTGNFRIPSTWCFGWSSSTTNNGAADTALCRTSANALWLGNGTPGDGTGGLNLGAIKTSSGINILNPSGFGVYNLISLNSNVTATGNMGIQGDGSGSDLAMYLNVATGGSFKFRHNNGSADVTINASGVTDPALASGDMVQASTGGLLANGPVASQMAQLRGTITLTTATTDTLTLTGLTTSSVCSFSPSNSTATTATILPWYSVASNTFTMNHAATVGSGATYGVLCTVN